MTYPSTADLIIEPPEESIDFSRASRKRQIFSSVTICLGGFATGNCLGWSSPVQPQIQLNSSSYAHNSHENGTWYIGITPYEMSWAASLMNIGALFGALAAGLSVARLGRKRTIIFAAVPFAIGWIMISFSTYPAMLYAGRITTGIAHGICLATIPSYLSEIATPNIRGTTGFFFTFSMHFGTLTMSALGLKLYWRVLSILPVVPLVVLAIGMLYVPEPPILLLKKGKREEALEAIRKLRGPNYPCEKELNDMEDFIKKNFATSANIRDLCLPHVYKPMLLGIFLMVMQQFAGFNATGFYSAEIFRLAGSSIDPLQCSLIINTVGLISNSLIASFVADKVPRRLILAACEACSCSALTCLGLYFYLMDNNYAIASNLLWLPLVCLICSTLAVTCGLGAIPWIVSSEVLPVQFRGPGGSMIAFTNRLMSFVVTKTFFDLQSTLTIAGTFWFYAGCCCLGFFFSLLVMPETKGKTHEEIQQFFIKR